MVPVALARPLWWLALRSLRFMIALVLLALAVGTASGPAAPPGTTTTAAATTADRAAPPSYVGSPVLPGQTLVAPGTSAATGRGDSASTMDHHAVPGQHATFVAASVAEPATPWRATPVRRAGGDAYGWTRGERAPPRA